ncbi:MAG: DUF3391 domain-containing protein, partial [Xanthomonadales bacterium]|nr:DUF3391 domain-containing protein [Xanthomonadales bacterium]
MHFANPLLTVRASGRGGGSPPGMSVSERRVRVTDLQVGMYVSQLDRPWDGTPFPLQGFR